MNWTMITALIMAGIFVIGIPISIIGYFGKRSDTEFLKRFDELNKSIMNLKEGIDDIRADIVNIKIELKSDYAKKKDVDDNIEKYSAENKASHSTIWGELNNTKERITRVEARCEIENGHDRKK